MVIDTTYDSYGYINQNGDTIIPFGKYPICFTDTIRELGFVYQNDVGFIGINHRDSLLFNKAS